MPNTNRPKAERDATPAPANAPPANTAPDGGKNAPPAHTLDEAKPQPATAAAKQPAGKTEPSAGAKPTTAKAATGKPATGKTATGKTTAAKTPPAKAASIAGATTKAASPKPSAKPPLASAPASKAEGPASTPDLKVTVTQTAKPAAKNRSKPAEAKPAEAPEAQPAAAPPAPRKAMSNAAATQALMASAAASKEAAARNAAKAAAEKAAAEAAAAAPPPPPVQTISPPIASRPGMSRPGMPGMRPAFSITPRMPMGALRSGGMAEAQAGAPGAPKGPPVKVDFRTGDMVVYPTHGVGTVQGIEDVNVAGISLQVITVTFEENRMTLRVPTNKAASAGLRKLAGPALVKLALDTLKGRARIKRTMWSRRAQEYEAKINSGDPVAIAEVVRDLFRNAGQPDQSFSERQIYEQALDRLAMEFAAIEKTDKPTAIERLIAHMRTAEKPGAKPIEEALEEE